MALHERSDVTAVSRKTFVPWVVTPCSLVEACVPFRRTYRLDLGNEWPLVRIFVTFCSSVSFVTDTTSWCPHGQVLCVCLFPSVPLTFSSAWQKLEHSRKWLKARHKCVRFSRFWHEEQNPWRWLSDAHMELCRRNSLGMNWMLWTVLETNATPRHYGSSTGRWAASGCRLSCLKLSWRHSDCPCGFRAKGLQICYVCLRSHF
jgi:hypothetical protein